MTGYKTRCNGMISLDPMNFHNVKTEVKNKRARKKTGGYSTSKYSFSNEVMETRTIRPSEERLILLNDLVVPRDELEEILNVSKSYFRTIIRRYKSVTMNGYNLKVKIVDKLRVRLSLLKEGDNHENITTAEAAEILGCTMSSISAKYGRTAKGYKVVKL